MLPFSAGHLHTPFDIADACRFDDASITLPTLMRHVTRHAAALLDASPQFQITTSHAERRYAAAAMLIDAMLIRRHGAFRERRETSITTLITLFRHTDDAAAAADIYADAAMPPRALP